jgi:hypothetical protein
MFYALAAGGAGSVSPRGAQRRPMTHCIDGVALALLTATLITCHLDIRQLGARDSRSLRFGLRQGPSFRSDGEADGSRTRRNVELVKRVVHMAFDGELGDREDFADLAIAATFRDQPEDLALAVRKRRQSRACVYPSLDASEFVQHEANVVARKRDLPRNCASHDPGEAGRMHSPIDDAARARAHDRKHGRFVRRSRNCHRFNHRRPPLDAQDRLNSAARWELDVNQHDGRLQALNQAGERFARRSGHRADISLAFEQGDDARSEHAVRIRDNHSKALAQT